ncbi:aminotransferase A [Priestia abyssalis]|uniref:aminotransferase A n=1 Tax=Priestia abyssalis TaxID=1221450 RepID=UPI0009952239|nr:aminotransferase A [Priestia abyssalis]
MEHLINPLVQSIQISGIRRFFNMVSQHENVLSLTIGQPDFSTPNHVKAAGKNAIDQNMTSYTHNAGMFELREAAASFMDEQYDLAYDAQSEVIVTTGASEAIDVTLRTILSSGSEVLLPGPVYPGYEPIIRLCGAQPIHIDTTNTGFRLTADLMEPYITERTRCIVLPYPSNPTGMTLSAQELRDIALLLENRDIFVLSDEIYSEFVFTGQHHSIASFPKMKEKTIVINGLSKSHAMTGWRIGFLFAPANICRHILKVHQYNVTCASSISQSAALSALTTGKADPKMMKIQYEQRMNYVYNRLLKIGFDVEKPNGAFYIFPSIHKFHHSSFEFALELMEKAGVALVPGNAFSSFGEGYVRLSYAYASETLTKALDRIEQYMSSR